ncbi:glycoside hydrolase family 2 protein [Tenuifilum thalassicum]|uniref:beta-mannosidase n=1 Tax=Tenuifilum thalassicum TaxID=2590900 RepID=A0A7D3XHV8_9BACT|nr:glycoside hydrolase family 2 protein [Tenuifilum thalassicum]QKG80797.1 glycoside hydrolase family 2 protein [Tenuifilum thalassicum]
MKRITLSLIAILISAAAFAQQTILLNDSWVFRQFDSQDTWLPAKVPGSVHTDLFANGKIPNPFLGCNNMQVSWIDSVDWEYRSVFDIPDSFNNRELELVFDGLDTHADVFLNTVKILRANNMFRRCAVSCTNIVRNRGNELRIVFHSSIKVVDSLAAMMPFRLPGGEWAYVRKAAYHFGWDWGPRFVTCGIWKPIYLRIKPKVAVENIAFVTLNANPQQATMLASFNLVGNADVLTIKVVDLDYNKDYLNKKIRANGDEVDVKFTVDNPKLWWPNGMGNQNLSRFKIMIYADSELVYSKIHEVGIRTVRLVSEPDSIGQSFYLEVNGRPMFAKGANLIPPNFFVHSISDSAWIRMADLAAQSNFNMLRVWGGGVYAPDAFMEECTRKGILVWHDFMFACSMYPYDSVFQANVREEAIQQVKRLRKHTSLALWCGNNEVDEGWHNWGWQNQLTSFVEAPNELWGGYQQLFHELLPSVVARYDSTRCYWPSSPMFGWGNPKSMTHGDSHYWGVWWGREPIERYLQKVPRFMSEYGFQGAPSVHVMQLFNDGKNMPDSAQLLCHQKHPVGYQTINEFLQREGFKPNNLYEWVESSQMLQAQGYAHAIEAQRLSSPYCMGTLYWQLNDCWPVVSWSSVDYEGNWKRVQHYVKNLYKPVIAGAYLSDSMLVVKAVSDSINPVSASISTLIKDVNGNQIAQYKWAVGLKPNVAVEVGKVPLNRKLMTRNDIYLDISIYFDNKKHFESVYYFTRMPHKTILQMDKMVQRLREKVKPEQGMQIDTK